MASLSQHDVRVDNVNVRVTESGDGPPLLLIHGFLVSHREWLPMFEDLSSKFRVIAPDLPAFGESAKDAAASATYGWVGYARLLAGLLAKLNIERAHVAGHSMGGGIALTLAADFPARVNRIAAIDAACFPFAVPLKGRIPLIPVLGPLLFKRLYGRALFHDYFKNEVWSGHPGIDLSLVDAYYADFEKPGARDAAYEVLLHTVDPTSVANRVPKVKAETLVLWGDEDRLFPLSIGQRLARELPNATLKVFDRCGHAPNEERPRETAAALTEFFLADHG